MTVTLGWSAIAALFGLAVLAFWLGRVTAGGRRDDLSGLPSTMPRTVPPPHAIPRPGPDPAGLQPEQLAAVRAELARGDKIAAIKLFREMTGLGLKESKDAVEAMQGQ